MPTLLVAKLIARPGILFPRSGVAPGPRSQKIHCHFILTRLALRISRSQQPSTPIRQEKSSDTPINSISHYGHCAKNRGSVRTMNEREQA